MARNLIYLLLIFCLFFVLSLPHLVDSSQGLVFIMEELIGAGLLIIGFILFKPLIKIVANKIHQRIPWQKSIRKRLFTEMGLILLFSTLLMIILISIAWLYVETFGQPEFHTIKEQLLEAKREQSPAKYSNSKFVVKKFSVFHYVLPIWGGCIFLFTTLFGVEEYFFFNELEQKKKIAKEQADKELALSKVYALQHQLNPHFMFNTLNVLAGLMHEDVEKADQFIKKLSEIYRYVLVQSEEVASTLDNELKFAESYIYLLKIRFEDKLHVNLKIDESKLNWFLPSLTLELLIENAIKHNSLETQNPLNIEIIVEGNNLIVKNNILPRIDQIKSTKIGIKNLQKRLSALGVDEATFTINNKQYVAVIPLIKPET